MIYIGNTEAQTIYGGTTATNAIYIGNYLTFPSGTITYALSNAALHYSSGSGIYASGTNYAYIDATVKTYRNGTLIKTENNVRLTPYKVSDSTGAFIIQGTEIHCNSRGTTTGALRNAVFKGYYNTTSYITGEFTVQQYGNYATDHNKTIEWEPENYGKVTYAGADIQIYGDRRYEYWTSYTSGAETTHYTTWDMTTATSYNLNGTSWMYLTGDNYEYIHVNTNNTASDRDASIVAYYKGTDDTSTFQGTVNVSQWRKMYTTTEYRINEFYMDPSLFTSSQYGASSAAVLNISADKRTKTWRDGYTTYGSWSAYSREDEDEAFELMSGSSSDWKFAKYSDQYTSYDYYVPVQWVYDYNKGRNIGKAYVYPTAANTTTTDKECLVEYFGMAGNAELTVVQKGIQYYITLPPSTSVAYSATSGSFSISTNVPSYTISYTGTWIKNVYKYNNTTIRFTCEANTTSSARSSVVTITGSGVTASCTIYQLAAPAYSLDLWLDNQTQITQYSEFTFSDETFTVYDRGTNNREYNIYFDGGTLQYTINDNEITFSGVTSSTDIEISIEEASSEEYRVFQIIGE